jgi:uncharacterized surface protein with fasciclin (FAS1) repeats
MHFYINGSKRLLWLVLLPLLALQACNKEFEDSDTTDPVINKPGPTGTATLAEIINTDTSFSFLKAAVAKAGVGAVLNNKDLRLTLFAPDNAAFRRSLAALGLPPVEAALGFLDTATVRSIVTYHLTPGYLPADSIPASFPNLQYATFLNPAPQLSPLLRLTIFPSRSTNGAYVNNIPITGMDIAASNGVLHKVFAVVLPPSKSIYEIITADTSLTYLVAAMQRADSGRTSIADGSLVEASKSIGANLTLFAPVNNAFRTLLSTLGYPPSPAVIGALPVTLVRGLIAYHLLTVRAFSVNMPTTATFFRTALNSGVPNHPGVNIAVQFTGPFVTSFNVTGVGNNNASAGVIEQDRHATNGVIHKINRVLLPQPL